MRRQSYDLNEESLFNVEYADILGIPFDFAAKPVIAPVGKPRETIRVHAVRPDRDQLEIRFPRVEGYRVELPEEQLDAKFGPTSVLELTPALVGPSVTKNQGIIGEGVDLTLDHLKDMRQSTVLFHPTRHLLYNKYRDPGEEPKLHLFGQLKRITRQWMEGISSARAEPRPRSSTENPVCCGSSPSTTARRSTTRSDDARNHRIADQDDARRLRSGNGQEADRRGAHPRQGEAEEHPDR